LLHNIRDEAQRMHATMSDLLDLTRMEEGAVAVRSEWCPADDLVAEARAALGSRLRERTLRVNVPADATVWCDPRLVQQALVNLIDNALLHTPRSSTIEVCIEVADTEWRLIVADDGPGLPRGLEREMFKKFMRLRDEPTQAGTGLGLAICAAVVRLHGGTIVAANNGGARFTLALPQPATPDTMKNLA
jgi:two-component system sensor histidine kinase KdpD